MIMSTPSRVAKKANGKLATRLASSAPTTAPFVTDSNWVIAESSNQAGSLSSNSSYSVPLNLEASNLNPIASSAAPTTVPARLVSTAPSAAITVDHYFQNSVMQSPESISVGLLAGILASVLCVLLSILVAIWCWKRRKLSSKPHDAALSISATVITHSTESSCQAQYHEHTQTFEVILPQHMMFVAQDDREMTNETLRTTSCAFSLRAEVEPFESTQSTPLTQRKRHAVELPKTMSFEMHAGPGSIIPSTRSEMHEFKIFVVSPLSYQVAQPESQNQSCKELVRMEFEESNNLQAPQMLARADTSRLTFQTPSMVPDSPYSNPVSPSQCLFRVS